MQFKEGHKPQEVDDKKKISGQRGVYICEIF